MVTSDTLDANSNSKEIILFELQTCWKAVLVQTIAVGSKGEFSGTRTRGTVVQFSPLQTSDVGRLFLLRAATPES